MQSLELLTAEDVAVILKISGSSVWNWHYGRKKSPVGFPPPSQDWCIGPLAIIGHRIVHCGFAAVDHRTDPHAWTAASGRQAR
jgi:hypothetical protein